MLKSHIRNDWSKWPPIRVFSLNGTFTTRRQCRQVIDLRRGEVIGNLALLYNLGVTPLGSGVRHVSIIASSFGPLSPPLPIARSITVAQITSPTSSNGSSLLDGLQKYFRKCLRLVKRGDVLIIPTETDPLAIHISATLSDIPNVSGCDLWVPL